MNHRAFSPIAPNVALIYGKYKGLGTNDLFSGTNSLVGIKNAPEYFLPARPRADFSLSP
jgi:hypothetical protein